MKVGMIELKAGQGKTVIAVGQNITIIKKGWLFASQREKVIPIRNIASVEIKKPGALIAGFIQFSIAGGLPRDSSFTNTGGAWGAVQDENSAIISSSQQYEIAIRIRDYISDWKP